MIAAFVDFREEVVVRRTKFELSKARDRGHVLVGLAIAVANIDEVIHIIRSPETRPRRASGWWPATGRRGDMLPLVELIADPRTLVVDGNLIRLTDEQARAILALTPVAPDRPRPRRDLRRAAEAGRRHQGPPGDPGLARRGSWPSSARSWSSLKAEFAVPRRTEIVESDADVEDEDLIAREDMVITVTHGGYVKRTPLATYRTQHRGGKGRSGMATKEEDAVTASSRLHPHAGAVLLLGRQGLPAEGLAPAGGTPTSRGKALVNLLPIEPGESITSILPLPEDEATWDSWT